MYADVGVCGVSASPAGIAALRLGTIRLAHHFEAKEPADYVFLYGLLPTLGVAALVTLTGNIVTLVTRRNQATWGGVSLVLGTIAGLGLLPFFAAEGAEWTLVPLVPAAVLIALGITNLVLGLRDRATETRPPTARSPKASVRLTPWVSPGARHSVQVGLSLLGTF